MRKLYVKGKCFTCIGKKIGCNYCDRDGLSYIEASDKTLKEWFLSLDADRKKEILNFFTEQEK